MRSATRRPRRILRASWLPSRHDKPRQLRLRQTLPWQFVTPHQLPGLARLLQLFLPLKAGPELHERAAHPITALRPKLLGLPTGQQKSRHHIAPPDRLRALGLAALVERRAQLETRLHAQIER